MTRHRTELLLLGAALATWWTTMTLFPWPGIPFGAAVIAAGYVSRNQLLHALYVSRVRRAWAQAEIDSGAADPPPGTSRRAHEPHGSRIERVEEVPAGDLLHVRAPRGSSVTHLAKYMDRIGSNLDARLEIVPDMTSERRAEVLVRRRDPFADYVQGPSGLVSRPVPWPNLDKEQLSLWEPIPLGIDDRGKTRTVNLVESNLLIGGIPGMGKSVALSIPVATAALDPDCRLWLMDGKKVEFPAWAGAAYRYVDDDRRAATDMLKELLEEVEKRYSDLKAKGQRKVQRSDGLPLHLLACDELALYLLKEDGKKDGTMAELLRRIAQLGRSGGIITAFATQKPDGDTVPTALRDLLAYRLALRSATPQASDTILGQGWASVGANAQQIPDEQKGVGFLLAEGERPAKIKGFNLTDDDVHTLAQRAAGRRVDEVLAEPSITPE